jgi:hypothetical protein
VFLSLWVLGWMGLNRKLKGFRNEFKVNPVFAYAEGV